MTDNELPMLFPASELKWRGVLKDYLLRGYAVHQQVMALQQKNLRIDAQNDRIARIEDTIEQQQQQLDFVVRAKRL